MDKRKGKIVNKERLAKLAEARKKSLEVRRRKAAERKAAKAKKKEEEKPVEQKITKKSRNPKPPKPKPEKPKKPSKPLGQLVSDDVGQSLYPALKKDGMSNVAASGITGAAQGGAFAATSIATGAVLRAGASAVSNALAGGATGASEGTELTSAAVTGAAETAANPNYILYDPVLPERGLSAHNFLF